MYNTLVKRRFTRSAANYDRMAEMQRSISDELIDCLDARRKSVVDLGCGTGYVLRQLAELGFSEIHGLDIASTMLDLATTQSPQAELTLGSIEALPYENAQFATVLSSSAVQWCDLAEALAEMHRVIQPGGQLLLSTFIRGTLQAWRRKWGLTKPNRFVGINSLALAIKGAGFIDARIRTKTYHQSFNSFDSAVASIRDLGAGHNGTEQRQGLMGRQWYAHIKADIDAVIEQRGYIDLEYNVAFVDAVKRGVGNA